MKRKILVGFLALAMTVSLFGCGSKEQNNANASNAATESKTTTEQATTPTEEAKVPEEVKVVTIWSKDAHSKDVYERNIEKWNAEVGKEKGIEIVYEVKDGGTLNQAIEVAIQAGEAPELFWGGSVNKLIENGDIIGLEDVPGGDEILEMYADVVRPNATSLKYGKTFAVPTGVTVHALVYNKDMFKAAGLVDENGEAKPPETVDELREYAKILTNPEKKEFGIVFPMKAGSWFNQDIGYATMASTGFMDWNPKAVKFEFPNLAKQMSVYLGIKEDGSYYPGSESLDDDAARARFAEGGIGMKYAMSYDVAVYNTQFPAKIDWGVAPIPVVDKDNKYLQRMSSSTSPYINAKSLETVGGEAILEVYKFLTGKELLTDLYESGCNIPVFADIIENSDISNAPKGWAEFGEISLISTLPPAVPSYDTSKVTQKIADRFLNNVWAGKETPEEAVAIYEEEMNAGLTSYYEAHPDEKVNLDALSDANWDVKR